MSHDQLRPRTSEPTSPATRTSGIGRHEADTHVAWLRSVPQAQLLLEVLRTVGPTPAQLVELAAALFDLGPDTLCAELRRVRADRPRASAHHDTSLADFIDDRLVFARLPSPDWPRAMAELVARVLHVQPDASRDSLTSELARDPAAAGWLLGGGVAIPHALCHGLTRPLVAVANLRDELPLDTPDGQPVTIVFVLLDPPGTEDVHLHLLARIAHLCGNDGNIGLLRAAMDGASLADAIVALEQSP